MTLDGTTSSPLADLDEQEATATAARLRVLADPVRIQILSLVANAQEGELCACEFPSRLDRSQPTVSYHLSLLVDAGYLTREKRGRWAWYRLVPQRLDIIRALLARAPWI
jgi:ArsR family transcriptional regulator, arsenate/arsenite/antimonite-responsive transcriptional repressor